MFHYSQSGKIWFIYFLLAYVLINVMGSLVLNKIGIVGFSQTPFLRGLFIAALAFGALYVYGPLYLFNNKISLNPVDVRLTVTILLLVFYSVIIGLVNDNSLTYIISDSVYLIVGIAIYLFTRFGKVHFNINKSNIIRISLFTSVLVMFFQFIFDWPSVSLTLFYFALFLYTIFIGNNKAILLNLIPIAIISINSNRATLLTLVLMTFVLFFIMTLKKKTGLVTLFSYIGIFTGAIIMLFLNNILDLFYRSEFVYTPLGQRIFSMTKIFNQGLGTVDISQDITIAQRLHEVAEAVNTLGSNVIYWLFGYGSGGTIDMSSSLDLAVANSALLGADSVHNIHLLHGAILFRYGLIGIAFLIYVIFKLISIAKRTADSTVLIICLSAVSVIIYSIPASSFLTTEPLIWFAAAMIVNRNEHLIKKPT